MTQPGLKKNNIVKRMIYWSSKNQSIAQGSIGNSRPREVEVDVVEEVGLGLDVAVQDEGGHQEKAAPDETCHVSSQVAAGWKVKNRFHYLPGTSGGQGNLFERSTIFDNL